MILPRRKWLLGDNIIRFWENQGNRISALIFFYENNLEIQCYYININKIIAIFGETTLYYGIKDEPCIEKEALRLIKLKAFL